MCGAGPQPLSRCRSSPARIVDRVAMQWLMDYLGLMGKQQLPYAHLPATLVVRLLQAGKDRGVGRVWLPAYGTNSSWSQPEIWVLWLGIILL